MEEIYFKIIGVKTDENTIMLLSAVKDNFLENVPEIFEVQCVKLPQTIYTGSYPNIRMLMETVKERKDLVGYGATGILRSENWYNVKKEIPDSLGIGLKKKEK